MQDNSKIMGRPTKYKPDYNDKVIELFKQGASVEEICLELDICKQTFYNWCESNKEFLDSKKKGVDFSLGWWMKEGRIRLRDKDFNYTGWYMNMKNRFGWADNQKTDITSDGKPITPTIIFTDGDSD